jgi:hypothetical protein
MTSKAPSSFSNKIEELLSSHQSSSSYRIKNGDGFVVWVLGGDSEHDETSKSLNGRLLVRSEDENRLMRESIAI